ncbi:MAG: leucine-rich repeat domain-containing protein [Ruminococcaceae bacterium]|nr:leucine-rich repeat domain-containing protein [Oscillospiraceae bacterium]
MKKATLIILTLLLSLLAFTSCGDDGTVEIIANGECGSGITWTLDENGKLSLSGGGDMKDFGENNSPWHSHRENIKSIVISDGITSIGEYAFYHSTSLVDISIPKSVAVIKAFAFADCYKLQSIVLPTGLKTIGENAFRSCMKLKKITLPYTLETIDHDAFSGCRVLSKISIPKSVTFVGRDAFSYWTSQQTVEIEGSDAGWDAEWKGNSWVKTEYFNKAVIIHEGTCGANVTWALTDDGTLVISGSGRMDDYYDGNPPWKNLKDQIIYLDIRSGIENIGSYAFSGCKSLVTISLPDGISTIGWFAFSDCVGITEITIPSTVTEVSAYAFSGWRGTQHIYVEGDTSLWATDWMSECAAVIDYASKKSK